MPKGYSRSQIVLHWATAGVILWQFLGNGAISAAWRDLQQGQEVAFNPLIALHVLGGLAILALVVWRLVLRARRGAPAAPEAEPPLLRQAAAATHGALYLLLVGLVVSGGMAWFGGIAAAAGAHEVLKALLLALVALHVLASLWHQFWLRDGLMDRMRRPQD